MRPAGAGVDGRRPGIVWGAVLAAVLLASAGCAGESAATDRDVQAGGHETVTQAPAPVRALPVYYVADTAAGPRLYREFHAVATSDPASDAVREMLASPAIDRDYRTLWPAGAGLAAPVVRGAGTITVDLTGVAGGPTEPELATLAVQQLVYTVHGALQSTLPVRVLVDGEPVERLWDLVPTAQPVVRADPTAVRSLVQIDAPADGATSGPELVVTGEAAVFEATLPWEVRQNGRVVRSGTASTAEGQRFSAFRFTVTLPAGSYEVRITEDDPSDGAGRVPFVDTRRVTITT